MRLEAVASDPGGFVASVRFLDGTNLLGTVTNTPFRLVLTKYLRGSVLGTHFVTAVATDDRGAETTSAPVRFFVVEQPGPPYLAVLSPRTGAFYIEPANVSIEVFLTTSDDSTPVEVLLGTNVVGTLPQCPFTMVLSNVLTGSYSISARQNGILGTGYSQPVMITVARLLIAPSQLSTNGQFSFDVQTAITNQPTVIETSRDLSAWQPVFTNSVVTNAFHYADVMRADAQPRFFRAVIHQ